MKNIIIPIIVIFLFIQCKAQSPVIDIDTWDGTEIQGAYFKDVNNYLNNFIGTWVYTNGNTTFKIVLKKQIKAFNTVYYEDYLIGEYQYIENGVEKINTIPQIDSVYPNQQSHGISGNNILENHNRPKCLDCLPNERRVELGFSDPIRQLGGELLLQRIIVNGQPALKAFKRTTIYYISMEEKSPYTEMLVPSGEYILIKQ
jgi:hypothetical protein